jgi:hydrogenase maturation protease
MKKKCIVGLGTPLYHDDGIGIYLLEQLQKHQSQTLNEYDFIDGGTGGFSLLHIFDDYQIIYLIDAVNMGEKPGTLKFFTPNEVKSFSNECKTSTHYQDFLQVIDIAKNVYGNKFKLIISGIQPDDMSFGEGLSNPLKQNIDKIIKQLIAELIQS